MNNLNIGNARIAFRNFAGEEGKFNRAGDRNFCILLDDPDLVKAMEDDGWNIKYLKPRDEDDTPQPYTQIRVSYDHMPPMIYLITSKKKTLLDESTIQILDFAEIANVDIVVRPYNWNVSGKTGIKGYVKSMYVTIKEDVFESKYEDIPESAATCVGPDCPVD